MDNSTHNTSELLVQYLDGELSGSEKDNLERQLETDASLNAELENLQLAREAVRSYGIKQQVAGIHQQMMDEMKAPVIKIGPTRRIIRISMAVAASVLVVFLSFTAYNFFTLSSNKLFADNYHLFDVSTVRDDNTDETLIEKAYKEKKYQEVISLAEKADGLEEEYFLSAISYLEMNNNTKAIEGFKEVLLLNRDVKSSLWREETEYYLALTYIRNKDYDLALEMMNKIQDTPGHLYYKKITGKLIRKVKMLKWR